MAVVCPRCGREYDVTLFEFGRTLWCTCGARVGVASRELSLGAAAENRFLADAMLGKLARWLRLLGFDCAYEDRIADAELIRRGVEQQRVILTRDRALPHESWLSGICVVRAEAPFEQLGEVLRRFALAPSVQLFSRCSQCNRDLASAHRADLAGRAPPHILATREHFWECAGCGRVYWEGSHTRRIRQVVERLLAEA